MIIRHSVHILIFVAFLLLGACNSESHHHGRIIGIQPYGKIKSDLIDSVGSALRKEYDARIVILPSQDIPQHSFINVKSPRYRADKIIRHLKDTRPDSLDYILAITDKDISTTKKDFLGNTLEPKTKYEDWGVFGLGYRPGPSCIVSTFRIGKTTRTNFVTRLQKISVHEIGHNLGLDHCDSQGCVMQDAVESISTVDNEGLHVCAVCRQMID